MYSLHYEQKEIQKIFEKCVDLAIFKLIQFGLIEKKIILKRNIKILGW